MLTSKEYDKILEANSMDMEVYEYVKQHWRSNTNGF
jgi:hypothetical protein